MRQSFIVGGQGRMQIGVRFVWDDSGTPTMVLFRGHREAAISLNDAYQFADYESAISVVPKISSALGLDYWSNIDRHAVLDVIQDHLDTLVSMPPAPRDGLDSKRKLMESGVTYTSIKAGGRTIMEAGL